MRTLRVARAMGRLALLVALPALGPACGGGGGGSGSPFESGQFRAPGFPEGDGTVFGVAFDPLTGGPLANLPVVLTPDDGLAIEEELASLVQTEALTNRRGEFTLNRLAPGGYVLFVRFDANHLGYEEVVGRVTASAQPQEARLSPARVGVAFAYPQNGGTVISADTARLTFREVRLDEFLTLGPETRPLYARVAAYGSGSSGAGGESPSPPRPRSFEADLGDEDLRNGAVDVPVVVGGLGSPVRLEGFLGLHVVYRDPRGGAPGPREIGGAVVSVVSR